MAYIKKLFTSGRLLVILLLGISSGLPYLLVGGTLKLWLKNKGLDIAVIGFFAFVRLPYTFKFMWAPFLDRWVPPFLGRRRGWLVLIQGALVLSLVGLSQSQPELSLWPVALFALLTSFFSASQDIVIDAYRREVLEEEELGMGSATAVLGYRLGLILGGASLAPFLSDLMSWNLVYLVMALLVGIGLLTTLFSPEPKVATSVMPKTLREAVVEPFIDFFRRPSAIKILCFILLYKIGDALASEMLKPFYSDRGFTNTQIGLVAGQVGIWSAILGGIVGGWLMLKMSIRRALFIFGIFQALSTLFFVVLAQSEPKVFLLALVIAFETFTSGMGTAAYAAYMASLTNKKFTATQYALLTSLMSVPMIVLGSGTGVMVNYLGWTGFFVACTLAAIPGLIFLMKFQKLGDKIESA